MARHRWIVSFSLVVVALGASAGFGRAFGGWTDGRDGDAGCALALAGLAFACGRETSVTCPGGAQPFSPTGVAFGAAGEAYVTDALNGSVFRLDGDRCDHRRGLGVPVESRNGFLRLVAGGQRGA